MTRTYVQAPRDAGLRVYGLTYRTLQDGWFRMGYISPLIVASIAKKYDVDVHLSDGTIIKYRDGVAEVRHDTSSSDGSAGHQDD